MTHVVLVEDDPAYAEELVEFLELHGMKAIWLKSFADLAVTIRLRSPDLLVLDQFVAGMDAVTLLFDVRRYYNGGIVLLTGNQDATDRIVALETGADDFVTKSLGPRELLARLRAICRRMAPQSTNSERHPEPGRWIIDSRQNRVQTPNGTTLQLTYTELHILIYLVKNPGRVIDRDELSVAVLRRRFMAKDRSIDNMLSRIRVMLTPHMLDHQVIRSVRGRGYVFPGLDLAEESDLSLPCETGGDYEVAIDTEKT